MAGAVVTPNAANPLGSTRFVEPLPTYRFVFVSPPENPIGSSAMNRPTLESYQVDERGQDSLIQTDLTPFCLPDPFLPACPDALREAVETGLLPEPNADEE